VTPAGDKRVLMILSNPCNPDWRVLKEATALTRDGWRVTILAWDRSRRLPARETIDGVVIVRSQTRAIGRGTLGKLLTGMAYWFGALRAAARLDAEVIHCHDLPTLPVGVLLRWRRRRLVYDAHESYWLMISRHYPAVFVALTRIAERQMLRFVDQLITVNEMLCQEFRRHHSRVLVVGNWYDPRPLDRAAGLGLRRSLGIPADAFCLGLVGSLGPERLIGPLLSYAARSADNEVLVAGSGAAEGEVRAAADEHANLHFLGWQPEPDTVYAACDGLFYGLVDTDPYSRISSPNSLFLSIALRLPLVTTNTGEAGRIISETGAGELLADPSAEAIQMAVNRLRNSVRRDEVVAKLRSLQETYAWARAAQRLTEMYREMALPTSPAAS
jgi:glycosyltransferase involved in cell wall biosynthesis